MEALVIRDTGKHGEALVNLLFRDTTDGVQVYASDRCIPPAIRAVSYASRKFGEKPFGQLSYGNVELGIGDDSLPYLKYHCGFFSVDGYKTMRPINEEEWRKSVLVRQNLRSSFRYLLKRRQQNLRGELYIAGFGQNVPNAIRVSHYFRHSYNAGVKDVEMGVITRNDGTVVAGIRVKMK